MRQLLYAVAALVLLVSSNAAQAVVGETGAEVKDQSGNAVAGQRVTFQFKDKAQRTIRRTQTRTTRSGTTPKVQIPDGTESATIIVWRDNRVERREDVPVALLINRTVSLTVPAASSFRIAENETPRPMNRVFLAYDYFQNIPNVFINGGPWHRDANFTVIRLWQESGGQRLPLLTTKQNDTGGTGEIGFSMPVSRNFGADFAARLSYSYFGVSGSSSGSAGLVPVAVIPGAAGFDVFCFGQTPSMSYTYDFSRHQIQGLVSAVVPYGNVVIVPQAGARISHVTRDDRYQADFPGAATRSLTTSDTTVNSAGIVGGAEIAFGLGPADPLGAVHAMTVFANMLAGLDYNDARSVVVTQVTFPGFADFQRVSTSDSNVTPYVFLESGVRAQFGSVRAGISGTFEHGRYAPNVNLPGNGRPAFLSSEPETSYGVRGNLNVAFAPR